MKKGAAPAANTQATGSAAAASPAKGGGGLGMPAVLSFINDLVTGASAPTASATAGAASKSGTAVGDACAVGDGGPAASGPSEAPSATASEPPGKKPLFQPVFEVEGPKPAEVSAGTSATVAAGGTKKPSGTKKQQGIAEQAKDDASISVSKDLISADMAVARAGDEDDHVDILSAEGKLSSGLEISSSGVDLDVLDAEFEASVLEAAGDAEKTFGDHAAELAAKGEVDVLALKGEGELGAEVDWKKGKVEGGVEGEAGAYLAEAEGEVSGGFKIPFTNIMVSAGLEGSASAGLGAKGEAKASLDKRQGLKFGAKAGVTAGLGGSVGLNFGVTKADDEKGWFGGDETGDAVAAAEAEGAEQAAASQVAAAAKDGQAQKKAASLLSPKAPSGGSATAAGG